MIKKYEEVDALVLEGLEKPKGELLDWKLTLPVEVRDRVMAIVHAPGWNDAPEHPSVDAETAQSERGRSDGQMSGWSLALAIAGVVLLVVGIGVGFYLERAIYFVVCGIAAMTAFALAALLQRHLAGDWSTAFGISSSVDGNDENFRGLQGLVVIAVMMLVFFLLMLPMGALVIFAGRIIDQFLPQGDSFFAASTRIATLVVLGVSIWIAWKLWAPCWTRWLRALRGFLVCRLPPVCVSWLYDKKTDSPTIDETPPTVVQTALNNLPLLGIAVVCVLYAGRSQIAEDLLEKGADFEGVKKLRFLFLIASWVKDHPNTNLLLTILLGPACIGRYAYKIAVAAKASRARAFGILVSGISLVALIVLAVTRPPFRTPELTAHLRSARASALPIVASTGHLPNTYDLFPWDCELPSRKSNSTHFTIKGSKNWHAAEDDDVPGLLISTTVSEIDPCPSQELRPTVFLADMKHVSPASEMKKSH